MTLVSLTVSVNYADYLAWCLASLRGVVDAAYVVTREGDASVAVCESFGATPLLWDGWHAGGSRFNKSGAVRHGQEHIHDTHPDAWYLLIDADIVVPTFAREVIEAHAVHDDAMYSASRVDYHTPEAFLSGVASKAYETSFAGYFQLYRTHTLYAERSKACDGCDLAFAASFASRDTLPMTVGHLGCEQVNWSGRRSPEWRC